MLSNKPTHILLALTGLFLIVFLFTNFGFETFTYYKSYKLVVLASLGLIFIDFFMQIKIAVSKPFLSTDMLLGIDFCFRANHFPSRSFRNVKTLGYFSRK
ncbi:hypothetical protein GGR32_000815 [Mesonia hippocampi]|uniref:Uncharacterized protein n=1 Tax=Mesonia hippocampi TaxID=1628250 RepID=A0A840EN94_9FLAO|nr:hypothetical protein [Mesonia hippocampi]